MEKGWMFYSYTVLPRLLSCCQCEGLKEQQNTSVGPQVSVYICVYCAACVCVCTLYIVWNSTVMTVQNVWSFIGCSCIPVCIVYGTWKWEDLGFSDFGTIWLHPQRTSSAQLFPVDTPETKGDDTLVRALALIVMEAAVSCQAGKEGMSSLAGEK